MAHLLNLPTDNKEVISEALVQLLDDAIAERRLSAIDWTVVRHYLQGCRYFEAIEYDTGVVKPSYKNVRGDLPFKYEDIINKAATEVGRLMRLDTDPAIMRKTMGLDGLRKESTAQAILDAINIYLNPEGVKRHFIEYLVYYGFTGLLGLEEETDDPAEANTPSTLSLEVVPPWELLLLPASAKSPAEVTGYARQRWVPLDWVLSLQFDGKTPTVDRKNQDLEIREVPAGATVSSSVIGEVAGNSKREQLPAPHTTAGASNKKRKSKSQEYVRLSEVWLPYSNTRLSRYLVMIGRVVVHDKSWKNTSKAPLNPLSVAIRQEGIGLYGRGFVGPLIPLNAEVESAMLNLLRNVQDLDLLGLVGIPISWNVTEEDLEAAIAGRKYFWLDRDPSAPADRLEHIQPLTNGNLPRQVLDLSMGLMDRLSQQPDMVTQGDAPGRVDSNAALNFLYQTSTLPLGQLASTIASCYTGAYRVLLDFARKWDKIQLNLDTMGENSTVGIVFDPQTGSMSLSENVVPNPLEVNVGIRSQVPVNKPELEQKLLGMLNQQLISHKQFRLLSRLKGLDVPLMDDMEWQNYRMGLLRNMVLFNDGVVSGDISQIRPSMYEDPEIHLSLLHTLMASPEFAMASVEVQNAFNELVEMFETMAGKLPQDFDPLTALLEGPSEPPGMEGMIGPGGPVNMEDQFAGGPGLTGAPGADPGMAGIQQALQSMQGGESAGLGAPVSSLLP